MQDAVGRLRGSALLPAKMIRRRVAEFTIGQRCGFLMSLLAGGLFVKDVPGSHQRIFPRGRLFGRRRRYLFFLGKGGGDAKQ